MLTSLAYLFLLGLLLAAFFTRLKLPSLIGLIASGIILGPHCLNLLSDSLLNISIELRQIALVIILMRAGLSLNLSELKKVGRPALLMTFTPATFEILGIAIFAPLFLGVSLLDALVMGSVLAAVSPAVVVPKMLNLTEQRYGTNKAIPQMIMAAGSIDDVYVIVLFSVFTTLSTGGAISATSFASIPISVVTGLILGVATGWILVQFFKKVHLRDSIKLLVLISVAFLFLALENYLKGTVALSGLLAVMAMGATILQFYPILAKRISPKFSKLWVAAEILLFVLVGATVNIDYAIAGGVAPIFVILIALLFRSVGVLVSMIKTPLTFKERVFCTIAYIPKATVQAAIGSMPLAMGLACGEGVLTIAVLSILITAPLGALGIEATYKKLLTKES